MLDKNNIDETLQNVYLNAISDALNNSDIFLSKVQQRITNVYGCEVRYLVCKDADIKKHLVKTYKANLSTLSGTFTISDKAIRASSTSVSAFVNLLNSEMENLIKYTALDIKRQLVGDGSGFLCKIIDKQDSLYFVDDTRNLIIGQDIDIYNENGTLLMQTKIIDIDRTIKSISLAFVGSKEDFNQANVYTKEINHELLGLKYIFDVNNDLYGTPRDSHDMPTIKKINSEDIYREILENVPKDEFDVIICSPKTKRLIQEQIVKAKHNIEKKEFDRYNYLSINDIIIDTNQFVDDATVYILNSWDFELAILCDWEWLTTKKNPDVLKVSLSGHYYNGTIIRYAQLLCKEPSKQICLKF